MVVSLLANTSLLKKIVGHAIVFTIYCVVRDILGISRTDLLTQTFQTIDVYILCGHDWSTYSLGIVR